MRCLLLALFAIAAALSAPAQLLIKNVTVVDVENKKLLPGYSVLVNDGLITDMAKNIRYKLPVGTQVIDGNGKYLMPGLVDAHVHFFQSGGLFTRPDAIDLRQYKPYAAEIAWTHQNMEAFLRRYLQAGITTVVDVGATINFLQQRDSFRTKTYAPDVYMTGPLLTTWEPPVYKGLKNDEPFYEMKSVADAQLYVQKQLPYKPDFIKIWYIANGKNKDSAARNYLPMVQAAINEAHKAGLRVAVHATERITAQLAVEAGADFLVHGIDDEPVSAAFVQLLKNKNVVLSPTLVVAGNYAKTFGQQHHFQHSDFVDAHPAPLNSLLFLKHLPDTVLSAVYRNYSMRSAGTNRRTDSLLRANVKAMLDGGVTIATGTDAGNIGTQHVASYIDELRAMQQSGFNTWQLLQASTINGAKALGKQKETGSIAKGKTAHMLLLYRNPLDSLANWRSIDMVINKGVALKKDSIVTYKPEDLADAQLLAYNAHNLEAFLAPYADDVEVYNFPATLTIKGKEAMRKAYGFLTTTPGLYCRLLNRIVQGNTVIDHEEVTGFGPNPVYAVAIYEIKEGKIKKVYFTRGR